MGEETLKKKEEKKLALGKLIRQMLLIKAGINQAQGYYSVPLRGKSQWVSAVCVRSHLTQDKHYTINSKRSYISCNLSHINITQWSFSKMLCKEMTTVISVVMLLVLC